MGKGVRRLETEREHCFRDLKNKLDYQHRWSATVWHGNRTMLHACARTEGQVCANSTCNLLAPERC